MTGGDRSAVREGRLLEGRVAIVTGAGARRGLGRAIAVLFAAHGARVVATDIDGEASRETADRLGKGHIHLRHDVASRGDCTAAARAALDLDGRIDVLVNNAGVVSPARVTEIDDAEYARILDVNLKGTLLMTQAVVPAMRERGGGSIVNVSSVAGQRGGGIFGGSHYAASKAGVLGYTKAVARELGPEGIRANAICPSYINTDITAGQMTDEQLAAIIAAVPLGRAGRADEVAGAALFLASDLSSYVTGATIDVNGGSHIH